MKKRLLSLPQLLFVIGTRAALGAGVALLAGERMSRKARHKTGVTLAVLGAVSTIPAARIVSRAKPSLFGRLAHRLS